jgi:peptidoglycan biosynthesis protein MviN/MurJ (putative lipid II flippase)
METQAPDPISPGAAREQLRAAREARDASVDRVTLPTGFILALSVFCGAQTIAPKYKGPGNAATIIAVAWFIAELLKMSTRNQWRPLRLLPKPQWGVMEVTLTAVATLVGGLIGPHLLAGHSASALASWGLGVAVAVVVAACLFAAKESYRRRASRAWQQ